MKTAFAIVAAVASAADEHLVNLAKSESREQFGKWVQDVSTPPATLKKNRDQKWLTGYFTSVGETIEKIEDKLKKGKKKSVDKAAVKEGYEAAFADYDFDKKLQEKRDRISTGNDKVFRMIRDLVKTYDGLDTYTKVLYNRAVAPGALEKLGLKFVADAEEALADKKEDVIENVAVFLADYLLLPGSITAAASEDKDPSLETLKKRGISREELQKRVAVANQQLPKALDAKQVKKVTKRANELWEEWSEKEVASKRGQKGYSYFAKSEKEQEKVRAYMQTTPFCVGECQPAAVKDCDKGCDQDGCKGDDCKDQKGDDKEQGWSACTVILIVLLVLAVLGGGLVLAFCLCSSTEEEVLDSV